MTALDQMAEASPLEQRHRAWVEEVHGVLAPVLVPHSGIWDRWGAVQYLEREFLPRFERELDRVNRVVDRLPPADAARVWAPAELVGLLYAHLVELVRMAQSGAVFAVAADKFVRAHECWCREVGTMVAALRREALPADTARALDALCATADEGVGVVA